MNEFSLWEPMIYLIFLFSAYHVLAYLLLRFKKTRYLDVSAADISKNNGGRESQIKLIEQNGTNNITDNPRLSTISNATVSQPSFENDNDNDKDETLALNQD